MKKSIREIGRRLLVGICFCGGVSAVWAAGPQDTRVARNPRAIFQGEPHDKFGSNSVSYSFLPLMNNGFSVEYDRLLTPKTGRHWLKIVPTYFTTIHYSTLRKTDIEFLRGFSLGVYHRHCYFEIEPVGFQMYWQWGAYYEQHQLRTIDLSTTAVRKFGVDLMMGFRQIIYKPLFFDFSIGYGGRFLLSKSYGYEGPALGEDKSPIKRPYEANIFDFGYGGPALNLSFTIGFIF